MRVIAGNVFFTDNKTELLFKAFGALNKEILMHMSLLSTKIFWELFALLSSMIELTENVICGNYDLKLYDSMKLSEIMKWNYELIINYDIIKLSFTLYVPCLMCVRESHD